MQKTIRFTAFLLFFALSAAGCGGGTTARNADYDPFEAYADSGIGQDIADDARKAGLFEDSGTFNPVIIEPADEDGGAQASNAPPFLVNDAGEVVRLDAVAAANTFSEAPVVDADGAIIGMITVTTRPRLTSEDLAAAFGEEPVEYGDASQLSRIDPASEGEEEEALAVREFYYNPFTEGYQRSYQFQHDGMNLYTNSPASGVHELRLEYARLGVWNTAATNSPDPSLRYFTLDDNIVNPPPAGSDAPDGIYEVIGDFVYKDDFLGVAGDGEAPQALRFFPTGQLVADFDLGTMKGELTVGLETPSSLPGPERTARAAELARKHFGEDNHVEYFSDPTNLDISDFSLTISFDGRIDPKANNDPDDEHNPPTIGGYGFGGEVTFTRGSGSGVSLFENFDGFGGEFYGNFYDGGNPVTPDEIGGWVSSGENRDDLSMEGGFLGKRVGAGE